MAEPGGAGISPKPDAGRSGRFADLGPRLATAAVMAPVAFALVWGGGIWSAALVGALAALLAAEWRGVTARAGGAVGPADIPVIAAPVLGVVALHLVSPTGGLAVLAAATVIAALMDWRRGRADHAAWGSLGAVIIGLGCMAFLWLRETDPFGVAASLWIILVVVATDVGGYFAGRLIGGPKLWPAVSPKKTWAGLGGAVLLAVIAGALFSWSTTGTFAEEVCTVSAAAAVLAQLGDMGESAVKRRFGVKDSGRLFPGHGGALDRFDGLIAATLVVAAVTLWRGQTVFIWS